MKKGNEDLPIVTMTFIFIIFLNIVAPLFGMEKGVAIMVVLFWEFLVIEEEHAIGIRKWIDDETQRI